MKKVFKKVWKVISTILIVLMIAITLFLVVFKIVGETPSVFGYNLFYIVTGSMEPTVKVGDIILSEKVETSALKEGDVVTFNGESGELEGKIVTHRIVSIYEENGETYIITKGDANTANDPPHKAECVVAVMKCKIPLLGSLVKFINTPLGFVVLIVTPLLMSLVNEILELIRAFRSTKEEQGNEEMDK